MIRSDSIKLDIILFCIKIAKSIQATARDCKFEQGGREGLPVQIGFNPLFNIETKACFLTIDIQRRSSPASIYRDFDQRCKIRRAIR